MANQRSQALYKSAAYLISKGMPYDVVMALEDAELVSWLIAFGEVDGAEWDWDEGCWKTDASREKSATVELWMDGRTAADAVRQNRVHVQPVWSRKDS